MSGHSLCSSAAFWLVVLFPIWIEAENNATSANLPEQYQLCRGALEIEALQEAHGLIRVEATPTHAAMHPGWPEVLATIIINIGIFLWGRFTEHGVYLNRFVSFLLPFGITALWFATFGIAQSNYSSAGWISASLTTTTALLATIIDWFVAVFVWGDSRHTQMSASWKSLVVVAVLLCIGSLEVAVALAAVIQRLITSTGYGIVAYSITDAHGCAPIGADNDFSFLQRGVRSRIFSIIQLAQAVYSVVVVFAIAPFALAKGRRMVKEMIIDLGILPPRASGDRSGAPITYLVAVRGFARFMAFYLPVATLVTGVPLLLYGGIIATRGVPVVMSGTCKKCVEKIKKVIFKGIRYTKSVEVLEYSSRAHTAFGLSSACLRVSPWINFVAYLIYRAYRPPKNSNNPAQHFQFHRLVSR
ncbi:hypothetical protein B0H67DRAFT_612485 [Lasiosphaeris hirsuta]|uniref:Uncharacterized protein n=1 Tax=Lasiosphaeris hirsuta TaxID=260670 RepID=A0AA40DP31_9PEZI|nr:hypothetical protein B0H67DRAFT_612485 [Lasiosphaeris hirsuta]